jgi:hypothetical protein
MQWTGQAQHYFFWRKLAGAVLSELACFAPSRSVARSWNVFGRFAFLGELSLFLNFFEVMPFASLVGRVKPDCVRVLINREPVGPFREEESEREERGITKEGEKSCF